MNDPSQSDLREAKIVLAVDDDVIILMNTGALLEELGHEVIEANSGTEALEQLQSRSDIDVLITDQQMPGMTGSELIIAARAISPDLAIILATGYGETPQDADPVIFRLTKPYGLADLEKAVAEASA